MLSSVASRFITKPARAAIMRRKLHLSKKAATPLPVFPASQLAAEDAQLASSAAYKAARAKFSVPANKEVVEKTKKALEKQGHLVTVVADKKSALSTLQSIIPDKSSINLAGSTSLLEIGFVDYLTTTDRWDNLKGQMLAEKDPKKQAELRRLATTCDYAIASVDAVTENGEFIMVDASGTRVVLAHAPSKVILVVGAQKIVKDMETAWERVNKYSFETESARMRKVYQGMPGSTLANAFVCNTAPFSKGHFHFVILQEAVGF